MRQSFARFAVWVVTIAGCGDGSTPPASDAGRDGGLADVGTDVTRDSGGATDTGPPVDAGGAVPVTIFQIQDPSAVGHVAAGTVVRIEGALVSAVDSFEERGAGMFTGDVWIADRAGGPYSGLHVYMPAHAPCPDTGGLALGDVVTVEGRVQEFAVPTDGSGRTVTQIVGGNVRCTTSGVGSGPAPAPITVAELLDDARAERWEGVLVRASGLEAISDPDPFGALPLRTAPPIDDDLYRHMGSLRDTFTRLDAIFHYMYGRWAFYPRASSDVEVGTPRVIEWEEGQWGCADGADGDGDGAIDCADADCASLRFCDGPTVTVADVQDVTRAAHPAADTPVALAGPLVVTAIDTFEEMPGPAYAGTVVVQDPSAASAAYSGIHVFVPTIEPCGAALALGDRVYVAGTYREYADASDTNGTLTEIANGVVSCASGGAPLAPTAIPSAADLAAAMSAEPWEGVLVEIAGLEVTMPPGAFGRFVVTGGVAIDDDLYRASVVAGDRLSRVVGVLSYAFEYQLEPRSAADVVIAPTERGDASCGNGMDDDGDGATDCGDLDCCSTSPCAGAVSTRRLILSEVLYDAPSPGSDDGREWVEIRNAGTSAVPLACYALGNGGAGGYDYSIAQLPPIMVPAGGCVVIGGPDCGAASCAAALDFEPDYLNGPTAAAMSAGVALHYGRLGDITDATVPLDAVIYGTLNDGGLLDASGTAPAMAHVADAASGSIERTADGTWAVRGTPGPGTCTTFTPP